jgi:hypothetical protein
MSASGNIRLVSLRPRLGRQASAARMISPRHERKNKGQRFERRPKE